MYYTSPPRRGEISITVGETHGIKEATTPAPKGLNHLANSFVVHGPLHQLADIEI